MREWARRIDDWLGKHRALRLNASKTHIREARHGVDFVGRVLKPYRAHVRKSTVRSAKAAAEALRRNVFDTKALARLNSYLGIMTHSSSYRQRKALCAHCVLDGVLEARGDYGALVNHYI